MLEWLRGLFKSQTKLIPESLFKVEIDGDLIRITDAHKRRTTIKIADIYEFWVETNDTGPLGTDVWFVLVSKETDFRHAFPQGATGEQVVIDLLFKFPNFDFDAFNSAMSCVEVQRFLCWRLAT